MLFFNYEIFKILVEQEPSILINSTETPTTVTLICHSDAISMDLTTEIAVNEKNIHYKDYIKNLKARCTVAQG
jgi:hypothetical protein